MSKYYKSASLHKKTIAQKDVKQHAKKNNILFLLNYLFRSINTIKVLSIALKFMFISLIPEAICGRKNIKNNKTPQVIVCVKMLIHTLQDYFGIFSKISNNIFKIKHNPEVEIPRVDKITHQCHFRSHLIEWTSKSILLNLFSRFRLNSLNLFSREFSNLEANNSKSYFVKNLSSFELTNSIVTSLSSLFRFIKSFTSIFSFELIFGLPKLVDKTSSFILFSLCHVFTDVNRKISLGVYTRGN